MDVLTRENYVIAGSIALAIGAWYAVSAFTDLGAVAAYGVLIAVGVLFPTILLNASS